MAVVFSLRAPPACFRPRLSLCQNLYSNPQKMAKIGGVSSTATPYTERKLPILLFDVMDTVVRDPFYHDVPAFFGMTLKELIECKHPTAWMEFEKGIIDEMELARKLFKDGRPFDLEGLKSCMKSGYSYIEGVEELLLSLKQNNYEMHAFTNYPTWYQLIEDKLKLSKYLSWTFCSCKNGKRKPDPEFYMEVLGHLKVDPSNCIFMDDRMKNVEVATELGIRGIHFKNANALREELYLMGIDI
ncbi:flavin mononucleotide hydrolase 1, chloroplatic isoform X1 [Prosopis cineraria]|uniref:flavin mononucleotide hydrolase 1, chloroplatic isoform X1 n=2 Tax=Prosopis cineraria TaxID=364024 RepID=UPI00240F5C54|nr:flavin mononucleotide hydrolase 1, chloroplatic isoform X1 [Prosopis cineraria]